MLGGEMSKILNGAQITSVLTTIQNVKDGTINSNQAKEILTSGLGLTQEQANKIIGKGNE